MDVAVASVSAALAWPCLDGCFLLFCVAFCRIVAVLGLQCCHTQRSGIHKNNGFFFFFPVPSLFVESMGIYRRAFPTSALYNVNMYVFRVDNRDCTSLYRPDTVPHDRTALINTKAQRVRLFNLSGYGWDGKSIELYFEI